MHNWDMDLLPEGGGAFAYAPSIGYYFSPNFDGSIKYLAFSNDGNDRRGRSPACL